MTLHAHAHAWTEGTAPDYLCACGARARRDPRTGRMRVVDAEDAEPLLARLIAAVEAMPDFTGRPARADGMTHRCAGCGAWLFEAYTRRTPEHGLHHVLLFDGPGRVPEERPCGPVHDLSPVEGVLRADVIALLRRVLEET